MDWPSLKAKSGGELETHYWNIIKTLSNAGGMLGLIFRKVQNKIQDPAKLEQLIKDLIDGENWSARVRIRVA